MLGARAAKFALNSINTSAFIGSNLETWRHYFGFARHTRGAVLASGSRKGTWLEALGGCEESGATRTLLACGCGSSANGVFGGADHVEDAFPLGKPRDNAAV